MKEQARHRPVWFAKVCLRTGSDNMNNSPKIAMIMCKAVRPLTANPAVLSSALCRQSSMSLVFAILAELADQSLPFCPKCQCWDCKKKVPNVSDHPGSSPGDTGKGRRHSHELGECREQGVLFSLLGSPLGSPEWVPSNSPHNIQQVCRWELVILEP